MHFRKEEDCWLLLLSLSRRPRPPRPVWEEPWEGQQPGCRASRSRSEAEKWGPAVHQRSDGSRNQEGRSYRVILRRRVCAGGGNVSDVR